MLRKILFTIIAIYSFNLLAQPIPESINSPTISSQVASNMNIVKPENVLVIYNSNSLVSSSIKEYYKNARNISTCNTLGLDVPDTANYNGELVILTQDREIIRRDHPCSVDGNNGVCDTLAFYYYNEKIAQPISNYLNNTIDPNTGNYLKDQIDYIVLCKGIPLKIKSADYGWVRYWHSYHISIDGLLCLLKTDNNNNPSIMKLYPIPTDYSYYCRVSNPYNGIDLNFNFENRFKANHYAVNKLLNDYSNAEFKIACLVSRLDGRNNGYPATV